VKRKGILTAATAGRDLEDIGSAKELTEATEQATPFRPASGRDVSGGPGHSSAPEAAHSQCCPEETKVPDLTGS
jgi:hypothetical protein